MLRQTKTANETDRVPLVDDDPDVSDLDKSQNRLMSACFSDGFNSGYREGVQDIKATFYIVAIVAMITMLLLNRFYNGAE